VSKGEIFYDQQRVGNADWKNRADWKKLRPEHWRYFPQYTFTTEALWRLVRTQKQQFGRRPYSYA
jgi:hypothetical protein